MNRHFEFYWVVCVVLLVLLFVIAIIYFQDRRTCLSGHNESYYDNSGTSLFAATKNAGFLAQNGYKERFICDKYGD